jgi:hypothetical protein
MCEIKPHQPALVLAGMSALVSLCLTRLLLLLLLPGLRTKASSTVPEPSERTCSGWDCWTGCCWATRVTAAARTAASTRARALLVMVVAERSMRETARPLVAPRGRHAAVLLLLPARRCQQQQQQQARARQVQ